MIPTTSTKSLIDGFLNRVEYTNGEKAIDDLLQDCFHYMLYQEAVMKIFSWLGIKMKDSYDTIKKISKKKLKGEVIYCLFSVCIFNTVQKSINQ